MSLKRPDGWLEGSLSPEARSVISEANVAMSDWIDKSVTDLSNKIDLQITEATKALNNQVTQLTQQLSDSQNDLKRMLSELNQLKVSLNPGGLQTAIDQTVAKVKEVQDYLQQREQQWKNAGEAIVNVAVGAAKKMAAA